MFDWSLTPECLSAQLQALDKMALPPAYEPDCQSVRRSPKHTGDLPSRAMALAGMT